MDSKPSPSRANRVFSMTLGDDSFTVEICDVDGSPHQLFSVWTKSMERNRGVAVSSRANSDGKFRLQINPVGTDEPTVTLSGGPEFHRGMVRALCILGCLQNGPGFLAEVDREVQRLAGPCDRSTAIPDSKVT